MGEDPAHRLRVQSLVGPWRRLALHRGRRALQPGQAFLGEMLTGPAPRPGREGAAPQAPVQQPGSFKGHSSCRLGRGTARATRLRGVVSAPPVDGTLTTCCPKPQRWSGQPPPRLGEQWAQLVRAAVTKYRSRRGFSQSRRPARRGGPSPCRLLTERSLVGGRRGSVIAALA